MIGLLLGNATDWLGRWMGILGGELSFPMGKCEGKGMSVGEGLGGYESCAKIGERYGWEMLL